MATKSKRGRRTRPVNQPAIVASGEHGAGQVPAAVRVTGRAAARHIRACATACVAEEARAAIHAVARAIRRGTASARRAAALDAALAAGLDEAGRGRTDRWTIAEAVAWGLAMLARSRQGGARMAGHHLERLVAEARAGRAVLADRDTRPARFAVVLSRLFADVEACREYEAAASAAAAEEIGRLVTADGGVGLSGSVAVIERVVRWTGIRAAALALGRSAWDDEIERRWSVAAADALRLLGAQGRCLAPGGALPAAATAPLVEALAAARGARLRRTARVVRRGRGKGPQRGGRLIRLDRHDVASATTVIRTGWEPDAVRVLVEYRAAAPRLEIAVGDRLLVEGAWEWHAALDGRPLDAEGAWTVSGWESDRKAAFLEIAAPLAGGMRLERQVVVLRRQRIVLLADAVVPAATAGAAPDVVRDAGEIAWRTRLPLAPVLDAEPAAETCEVLVYDGELRFMALPLALPEWRTASGAGLTVDDGTLTLALRGHRRLYAPLWLDCDPRRIGQPLTWRQLTVADTRHNLPRHQAAGFRVQVGVDQWLLYRALDVPRNRTLLGCNVSSGFLLGRIKRSGAVSRTVEIE